ncbi:hypothetical protein CYMTET_53498 [Cymbomonas tetramitiformis]|uniref:THIF-type NAD/FAD binding fold domain-containing protein n=1 Tax=Cymbomonas tetramitiformis TaxID=36881 RepID=A0AAE0EQA6_9CHLO|nr:hypothetical protein CYMTET_53498 [Cymbomonas tetramitiformis]
MDSKSYALFFGGAAFGALAFSLATFPGSFKKIAPNLFLRNQGFKPPAAKSEFTSTESAKSQEVQQTQGVTSLLDDEILAEQFTRNIQFFGRKPQEDIGRASVVVVGLGGVGSHCANMLLRSGVGHLRIIDFDQVTLSSLNRHAVATRADVGTSKAECMKKHFARIFPEANVDARVCMYEQSLEEELLGGSPDFVIDAIDNIQTKVDLLAACHRRGLRVLCCAGAGAKADPTKLRFADICESSCDPLARAVRTRLRKDHGIEKGIPVLLSMEKQRCELVPCEGSDLSEYQVVPNFRVRTIPVLGTTPAIFGMACASYTLCKLACQPLNYQGPIELKLDQYEILYDRLVRRAEEEWGGVEAIHVDPADVTYLVKELWHGKSAKAPPKPGKGIWRSVNNLELTLWDSQRDADIDNLVLLTQEEADAHDASSLEETAKLDPEFVQFVEARLRQARRDHGFPGVCHW